MQELVPILGGAAFGAIVGSLRSRSVTPALVVAVCVVMGATASTVSGEIADSPLFLLWDTAQCMLAFVASRVVVRLLLPSGGPSGPGQR
jgi:hypothetical protein